MSTQPISKEQALKSIAASKAMQSLYSATASKWFKAQGLQVPNHVILYVDASYSKLFVAVISKPPAIIGFVISIHEPKQPPTDIRQYTMQKTKARQTYIMAGGTKFPLSGIFKAPIFKEQAQNYAGIRPSSRNTLYKSIASTEVVNEVTGIKFHVNIEVRLDGSEREAVVAFYDSRHFVERNNVGQFVADYAVSTIRNHQGGLILDGGVPAWQVTPRNCHQLQEWVRVVF